MALSKNMAYDHAAYLTVFPVQLTGTGTLAGGVQLPTMTGSGTLSNKFVAFTNMIVKSITTTATTVGTGTQTSFVLGSNAPALIRITNNGTTQVGTFTGTYQTLGSYNLPQGATAIATGGIVMNYTPQTGTFIGTSGASVNAVTGANNWALVNGGIPLNVGDQLYLVRGIDASEVVIAPVLECVLAPFANVSP